MHIFKNILVGVDLAQCKPLSMTGLNPIAWEPIRWAIKLAQTESARIHFLSVTYLSEETLAPLDEHDRSHVRKTIQQSGSKVLQDLVDQAKAQGVEAEYQLVPGKGWLEIIRAVIHGGHDLVVIGTRNLTGIRRMLFGNTAMKLLRRCPCPVLVTKVGTDVFPLNMLVATDLKPASQVAMRLGISLAGHTGSRLYILHVVEHKLDDLCNTGLPDDKVNEYRHQARVRAEEALNAQLAKTAYRELGKRLEVHVADGLGIPDVAVQHLIHLKNIDLLVMGTIGRGGIPGIMIGNTAERLLPEVQCSVLAVKPPDFVCPVDA